MHVPIDPPHPPQPLLSLRLDRNMSPPPIDQELMQLQMVQSMIKQEPKLDLAQVILDAVAASTRAASKNFADIFNCNNSSDSNSDHRRQPSDMNSNSEFLIRNKYIVYSMPTQQKKISIKSDIYNFLIQYFSLKLNKKTRIYL